MTTIFNLPVKENLNGLIFFDRKVFLIGLPVKYSFEPLGAIVGQKPHAIAFTLLQKNLFTFPKIAFPSCKTTLKPKNLAEKIVGNVGYPPKPITILGLYNKSK